MAGDGLRHKLRLGSILIESVSEGIWKEAGCPQKNIEKKGDKDKKIYAFFNI